LNNEEEPMNLKEIEIQVRVEAAAKVVFVLDASESAEKYQEAIVSLAQAVLRNLPAKVERTLYFLGNSTAYDLTGLAACSAQWFRDNRRRVSLITPVFEQLTCSEDFCVVVIGAGHIFDLEDWEGTPLLEHTVLVRKGEPLQTKVTIDELVDASSAELCRRVYDPVVHLRVSGQGFMPTAWSSDDYHLSVTGEGIALIGEHLRDYSLVMRFLGELSAQIVATVTNASGAQRMVPIQTVALDRLPEPMVGWLNVNETKAFTQAVQRQPFTCPRCGKMCHWDTLRCRSNHAFGHLVYPSLEALQLGGFILLRRERKGISFQPCRHNVLRLGLDKVAVKTEGVNPMIYRYDSPTQKWLNMNEVFRAYCAIGVDTYAVFI
jgi:hypothetical protein